MKFVLYLTLVACLGLHTVSAQGNLSGRVADKEGTPLENVSVVVDGFDRVTASDRLGRFTLRNLQPGKYTVTFSSVGFKSSEESITVAGGETTIVDVVMEEGELVLADVVVSDQLTRDINTISQVDIRLRPVTTSQDILRIIPGLFIAQHAGGGKAEQIFLRGFDIDHGTDINLEVDGMPVNMVSHAHGQGYSDLHFLIPELVGTVGFNAGPYEVSKGNLATAGYASFQTKSVLEENMVKVEGGRFGSFRNVNAIQVHENSTDGWRSNAYVASEYFRTDGFFEKNQHFNRLNLMGRYNAYSNDGRSLSVGLSTFNSRWDASGQIPVRAVRQGLVSRFGSLDPTEGGETSRTNVWVRYISTDKHDGVLDHQLFFSKYNFYLVSNFTFFLNDPVDGDQITQEESRSIYGYKGSYYREVSLGGIRLGNEIGYGFRYDDVNDIHLYRTKARRPLPGDTDMARGDIDETNLYAYLSETAFITDKLSVNAALRFDHFTFNYADFLKPFYDRQSVSRAVLNPKLNINYRFSEGINLFAKGGRGFHSNDTRVVVAQRGQKVLPYAYGADIGADFKIGKNLLVNAAAWMLDLDQEFVYVGDEGVVEPSGRTRRRGIDLSLRYQALPWMYFDADINVTDPRSKDEPEGSHYIPLAPKFTSIGGISFRPGNRFSGSLRYRYMADRPANEENSVIAEGYWILDAVLKYTVRPFEINLSVENILDVEWNEAQFDTESRLLHEGSGVSEIHFTPGVPLFVKAGVSFSF